MKVQAWHVFGCAVAVVVIAMLLSGTFAGIGLTGLQSTGQSTTSGFLLKKGNTGQYANQFFITPTSTTTEIIKGTTYGLNNALVTSYSFKYRNLWSGAVIPQPAVILGRYEVKVTYTATNSTKGKVISDNYYLLPGKTYSSLYYLYPSWNIKIKNSPITAWYGGDKTLSAWTTITTSASTIPHASPTSGLYKIEYYMEWAERVDGGFGQPWVWTYRGFSLIGSDTCQILNINVK